ncbi:MAG: hypothetical protein ACREC3_08910, partial [Methyloceanibacter sp.]
FRFCWRLTSSQVFKRRIVDALCICDKPGAFDFITKPIDLGGLRVVVSQALRVSERGPAGSSAIPRPCG